MNSKPPKIDGILDDEVWKQAPIATGLTQREPNDGEPATEETAFQVKSPVAEPENSMIAIAATPQGWGCLSKAAGYGKPSTLIPYLLSLSLTTWDLSVESITLAPIAL